jgi:hypothetical protein
LNKNCYGTGNVNDAFQGSELLKKLEKVNHKSCSRTLDVMFVAARMRSPLNQPQSAYHQRVPASLVRLVGHKQGVMLQKGYQRLDVLVCEPLSAPDAPRVVQRGADFSDDRRRNDQHIPAAAPRIQDMRRHARLHLEAADEDIGVKDDA